MCTETRLQSKSFPPPGNKLSIARSVGLRFTNSASGAPHSSWTKTECALRKFRRSTCIPTPMQSDKNSSASRMCLHVIYQPTKCGLICVILTFHLSIFASFRLSFIFSSQGIIKSKCFLTYKRNKNVTAVKRLPVHHHSADSIFWSFRIIGPILTQFENRVPPKPVLGGHGQCCTVTLLHMYSLNKTESAIFVSLMCYLLPENLHSELI